MGTLLRDLDLETLLKNAQATPVFNQCVGGFVILACSRDPPEAKTCAAKQQGRYRRICVAWPQTGLSLTRRLTAATWPKPVSRALPLQEVSLAVIPHQLGGESSVWPGI